MKYLAFVVGVALLASCSVEEPVLFADGSRTQLSQWSDKHLVINYWAEWCAPCRHEIPEFNQLHVDRDEHGVVVLGVNYDGIADVKLTELIDKMGIEFPTLVDDPQVRYGYERAETLPMTVIINPVREVQKILIGPQTASSIHAAVLAN